MELIQKIAPRVESFLTSVIRWAESRSDIANVALCGSHAHGKARADSDIDLIFLTTHKDAYVQDQSWLSSFGAIQKKEVTDWGVLTAVRAWFVESGEVEFGIVDPTWARVPVDDGTRRVVSDGIKILVDKDGALAKLVETVRKNAQ